MNLYWIHTRKGGYHYLIVADSKEKAAKIGELRLGATCTAERVKDGSYVGAATYLADTVS